MTVYRLKSNSKRPECALHFYYRKNHNAMEFIMVIAIAIAIGKY